MIVAPAALIFAKMTQPGNGFLEALTLPNVSTFTEPCLKVTERGFVDGSGKEHEVDIIICATGCVYMKTPL